jgi:hypothetical protein
MTSTAEQFPYRPDEFYRTQHLTWRAKREIMRRAHAVCFDWWFDELDCRKSFSRKCVRDISFAHALRYLKADTHLSVVHRYPLCRAEPPDHIEFSFRAMTNPVDYFLWIQVLPDKATPAMAGLYRL